MFETNVNRALLRARNSRKNVMGEPIDTHFDKQETPQGRHARQIPLPGRHARVTAGGQSAAGKASAAPRAIGQATEVASSAAARAAGRAADVASSDSVDAPVKHRPHGDAAEAALFAVPVEMLGERSASGEQADDSAERGRAAASRSSARHARVTVPHAARSRGGARHGADASRVAHNGAFISVGGAVIGGSSWSVRGRSLMAAVAVVVAALVVVGILATHGHAGANSGDQDVAQEALESQTLETAYAADDSAEAQQEQQPHDAEAAEAVAPGMRPDDADGFSRNRRDALGAMRQEAAGGFGRANVMQVVDFTGLSGTSASVPELFQYPSMPAGCEVYSLAAVLQAMGHDADPDSIVANQLPFDVEGDDYASAFWGDPYWAGEGMPPAIQTAGNAYLEEEGASERFANLTGTDFDELASKASSGTPVLVWTTLDFEDPYFDEPLEANSFYDLEHCVVLLGVEGHRACIMDPTQGYVTVNYSWFKYLYEQCGSMALAIA